MEKLGKFLRTLEKNKTEIIEDFENKRIFIEFGDHEDFETENLRIKPEIEKYIKENNLPNFEIIEED